MLLSINIYGIDSHSMSSDEAKRGAKYFMKFNSICEKNRITIAFACKTPELIESSSFDADAEIWFQFMFISFVSSEFEAKRNCNSFIKHERKVSSRSNRISWELCMDVSEYNERNMIRKMQLFSMRIIRNATENFSDDSDMIGFVWNF